MNKYPRYFPNLDCYKPSEIKMTLSSNQNAREKLGITDWGSL
uniref:Uncharacterized protein n=1 Tax=Siphoviridae sp. ctw757 TaxID=2827969 RepID=A0A8S5TBD2_9CAUD|nr:MAG TPA: hypothetical protein [Siphoviridae sp. ctw757]